MIYSELSTATKADFFGIIEICCSLNNEESFNHMLKKVESLIGQEMSVFGVSDLHMMKVIASFNAGFPTGFLKEIVDDSGNMKSPLFQRWMKSHSPQVYDFQNNSDLRTQSCLRPCFEYSLNNIISHGFLDCSQRYATYFSFARIPNGINTFVIRLVEMLAPYLHVAYTQLIDVKKSLSATIKKYDKNIEMKINKDDDFCIVKENLSARELEVLQWLFVGKSNWDISNILNISEYTVKNHVQRIIKKLNANNRQHATAKAIAMKLIQI